MKKSMIGMLVLSAMLLVGCGSQKAMNVDELSGRLLKEISYQDELSQMDLDVAGMVFSLDGIQIEKAAIYETSGWTAEEIVVMECASSADADAAKAMLQTRVEEQKSNYVDYVPEEMDKLNAAVIVESGNFVVLSVSNEPDKAKEIIGEYK